MNVGYWVFTWKLQACLYHGAQRHLLTWTNLHFDKLSYRYLFHQSLIFQSNKHRIPGDLCCYFLCGTSLYISGELVYPKTSKKKKHKHEHEQTHMNMHGSFITFAAFLRNKNKGFTKVLLGNFPVKQLIKFMTFLTITKRKKKHFVTMWLRLSSIWHSFLRFYIHKIPQR